MMLVRDVMTPNPITVDVTTSVATVRETMRQRRIHHLPVVDGETFAGVVDATQAFGFAPHDATAVDLAARVVVEAQPDEMLFDVLGRCAWSPRDVCVVTQPDTRRVLGIVTDRDLIRLASEHVDPSRPVDQIASTTVVTAEAKSTVGEALLQLREAMFRHLVVVQDGKLRGTASLRDLLLLDARQPLAERLPQPAPRASWTQSIREVATEMHRLDVDALPLIDDDEVPDGIVTVTDLLRALRSTPSVVG